MDANGDGRVSRSEARKVREASQTPSKEAPQTVNALKSQLLALGLSTKGVKSELMARLSDGKHSSPCSYYECGSVLMCHVYHVRVLLPQPLSYLSQ